MTRAQARRIIELSGPCCGADDFEWVTYWALAQGVIGCVPPNVDECVGQQIVAVARGWAD